MSGHPCGDCLRWSECNGTAWKTPDCTFCGGYKDPGQDWPKINPDLYEDKTESGLFEED